MDNIPILAFDRGIARVSIGNNYYIHHFKVKEIQSEINSLLEEFNRVEETQYTKIIAEEFNHALNLLKTAIVSRKKSWDAIGTVWKFIAGSPDANDLKLINSSMNELISNNNAQVTINNALTTRLEESLKSVKKAIRIFNSSSMELYSINIFMNLKYLTERIEIIIESIGLAKLGLTNMQLLSQNELDLIVTDIKRNKLPVHTTIEAISYTNTKVAVNKNELVLIINVPQLKPEVYKKLQIYPINNNHKKIYVQNPFLLSILPHNYIVGSLENNIYNWEDLQEDDSICIPKLLNEEPASCNFIANTADEEVYNLDSSHILLSSSKNFTLETTCGMAAKTLTGSFVIKYSSCEIFLNSKLISSNKTEVTGTIMNLPIYGAVIEQQSKIVNLSLEHLHTLHQNLRKEMEHIKLENKSLTWTWKWSLTSSFTIPILITFITVVIYITLKKRRTKIEIVDQARNTYPCNIQIVDQTSNSTHPSDVLTTQYLPPTIPSDIFRTEPQV